MAWSPYRSLSTFSDPNTSVSGGREQTGWDSTGRLDELARQFGWSGDGDPQQWLQGQGYDLSREDGLTGPNGRMASNVGASRDGQMVGQVQNEVRPEQSIGGMFGDIAKDFVLPSAAMYFGGQAAMGGGGGAAAGGMSFDSALPMLGQASTPSVAGAGATLAGGAGAGAGTMSSLIPGISNADLLGVGMSIVNRPRTPDFNAVAQQQGQENSRVAAENDWRARTNTTTPYGSRTFRREADPNAPGGYNYFEDIQFSPEQQAIYDARSANDLQSANLAGQAGRNLQGTLGQSFDSSSFGTPRWAPTPFSFNGGPQSERVQGNGGQGMPQQQGMIQYGTQPGQMGPAQSPSGPFSFGGGQQPQSQGGYGPSMARQGQAPRLGEVSGWNPNEGEMAGNGPSLSRVGQGPQGQTYGGPGADPMSLQGPAARDLYGQQGYEGARQQVQDSLYQQSMRYAEPQMQRDTAALDTQLRNQGLQPGTEAYNVAMQNLTDSQSRTRADARDRAIQAGGAEQSRLAGIDLAADAQRFGQQQTGFGNQMGQIAASQGLSLDRMGFNNQVGQQGFNNQLAGAGFNNQASQTEFGNQLAGINQRNSVGQNRLSNALALQGFNNQSRTGQFGMDQSRLGFNNAAGQQEFGNYLAGAGFNNQWAGNDYDRMLRGQQQGFDQGLANSGFNNTWGQQQINNARADRNQGLGEYQILQGMGQNQLPQFSPFAFNAAQPTNYMGAAQAQYGANADAQNYWTGVGQNVINGWANTPVRP